MTSLSVRENLKNGGGDDDDDDDEGNGFGRGGGGRRGSRQRQEGGGSTDIISNLAGVFQASSGGVEKTINFFLSTQGCKL